MQIALHNISKRFGYQWVIRDCSWELNENSVIAVSGPNGSGKSTLVKIISGFLSPTSGEIKYTLNGSNISRGEVYKHISLVGPYSGLIGEFTLREIYEFHFKFKSNINNETYYDFKSWLNLDISDHKRIMDYSSGMHQRAQLGLALKTNSSVLIFDEPTSFLDENAKKWFYEKLEKVKGNRTIIIASNDKEDFQLCDQYHRIQDLKTIS